MPKSSILLLPLKLSINITYYTRISNQMDPSNDNTVQTETTPPSYQRDQLLKELEEDMDRIREAKIETERSMRDQFMAQLDESYTKMEKLLAEITFTRQSVWFPLEHLFTSYLLRCSSPLYSKSIRMRARDKAAKMKLCPRKTRSTRRKMPVKQVNSDTWIITLTVLVSIAI